MIEHIVKVEPQETPSTHAAHAFEAGNFDRRIKDEPQDDFPCDSSLVPAAAPVLQDITCRNENVVVENGTMQPSVAQPPAPKNDHVMDLTEGLKSVTKGCYSFKIKKIPYQSADCFLIWKSTATNNSTSSTDPSAKSSQLATTEVEPLCETNENVSLDHTKLASAISTADSRSGTPSKEMGFVIPANLPVKTAQLVVETEILKQEKKSLESKQKQILDHNRQLEARLQRLERQLSNKRKSPSEESSPAFKRMCMESDYSSMSSVSSRTRSRSRSVSCTPSTVERGESSTRSSICRSPQTMDEKIEDIRQLLIVRNISRNTVIKGARINKTTVPRWFDGKVKLNKEQGERLVAWYEENREILRSRRVHPKANEYLEEEYQKRGRIGGNKLTRNEKKMISEKATQIVQNVMGAEYKEINDRVTVLQVVSAFNNRVDRDRKKKEKSEEADE